MGSVKCFNTVTGRYEEVEVSDEIKEFIQRSYWREDMQNRRFYKHCIYDQFDSFREPVTVEDIVLKLERRDYVATAFKGLTEREQIIVIEYYQNGRTLEFIAGEIGVSISYTSRLLKKSLQQLYKTYTSLYS